MINGPILVTDRLILRPPAAEDFQAFADFSVDEESTRFIGGVMEPATAWRAWCSYAGSWHINGFGLFSYIKRDTGEWVGRGGPWEPHDWPGKEVSYAVAPAFAGQGLALEANLAIVGYAFEMLKWNEVIHTIDPENHASIKLAQRLGASNWGPTRLPAPFGHFKVDKWGQTKEEWMAKSGSKDDSQ